MASRLDEILKEREKKIEHLRLIGIDLYPAKSKKDLANKEVVDNFEKYNGKIMTLAGRIMAWREHGKLIFGQIQDQSGRIQLFIRADTLEITNKEKQLIGFEDLELLDLGDIIQATGEIVKTRTGEVSLMVSEIKLLTKSRLPLPDKWEGITDPDDAIRKRYLDILMNEEKQRRFERKAKFWSETRKFLQERGFMEVETPVLESVTGGADAKPFTTHMNSIDQDFYLRISTELYQKRLIGAGYEKVFTLGPNFRNEGMDDEHMPEYYQCEWYLAFADYKNNMELVRDLYRHLAKEIYGTSVFETRGYKFDLSKDWDEIDYVSSIKEKTGIDVFVDDEEKMKTAVTEAGVKLTGEINRMRLIDNLWKIVRKEIAGPAFLVNVPKFVSPLAKNKPENPDLTERFQPIIGGSELGNGYSELNDPDEQLERFLEQQGARDAGDDEAQMLDMDFVEMLRYGMPPTSGFGFSERLFWFMENVSGREGTLFPPLRVKK
ncbi:lysine--tRNA ligase [Candidatus Collierbacteria bacterium RIFOXYD1_FULL_40_9]|uniref:Lysine--tRNA ligase n=1 Tax=Candidatus Collierbacteria bacterium RIFOXYD1_FULL_40_9 TaxID=1817731 RepID=A0A1F5FP13_9BACT|nr:MAG: lysine--tRNA ligase [Candidatus Collierbacteria bacterium RIFOXYD1_FULL_40_9]